MRFLVSVAFLLTVSSLLVSGENNNPVPEDPCSKEGGVCVAVDRCPDEYKKPGLCPKQKARGIDCCAIAPRDTCASRGGECTTLDCGRMEQKDVNHDCPPGTKCCVWV
uniref:U-scoloptoxin(19)-Sm1a n=1 Tax=Scolopendra morsitans TaxID=943129 RepID=TXJ1A_SCOMO|nr:RecName: Full=U-scoloptoxin(19)-Sm1a; Short=U-SLPTX(19)-Sm1a; Flags: Precursor [Scolopendra morsitans]